MTKWQMLSLIFIYLGTAYFADFLLYKHPFAFKSSFLLKITRFWRVLSKMEYSTIIQNGGSKTADASLPLPFLVTNDVIMTSLLLLN